VTLRFKMEGPESTSGYSNKKQNRNFFHRCKIVEKYFQLLMVWIECYLKLRVAVFLLRSIIYCTGRQAICLNFYQRTDHQRIEERYSPFPPCS
jgi:hypothetical protein